MNGYKLALVAIPAHWDASDLVHPSVNENGRVVASADVDTSFYGQESTFPLDRARYMVSYHANKLE